MHHNQSSEPTNFGKSAKTSLLEEEVPSELNLRDGVEDDWIQPSSTPSRSKNLGRIYTVVALILLVVGGAFGWRWWQSKNAQPAPPPAAAKPMGIPVKLAPVQITTVEESSEFVGTLESRRSVEVRSKTEGRVVQLYVKAGDLLRQGQIIARMESDQTQASLNQAKANLEQTQARLRELKAGSRPEEIAQGRARLAQAEASLAQALSGSRPEEIAQGRARLAQAEARLALSRAGTRPEEIAQAKARVDAARAEVELTNQRVNRYQQLRREGAISQDRLDEVVTGDSSAKANLREAERRLVQLQNGTRSQEITQAEASVAEARQALTQLQNGTRREEIDRLKATVEQERQALRQLENGRRPEEIAQAEAQVAQAQAQVRGAQVQVEDTSVNAPFAGAVGDVPIKLGDYVKKGDSLTTITENQSLDLNLSVPVERASQLRPGLPMQLLDAQGKTASTGQIGFLSSKIDPNSQSILAKATFDNSQGQLRDGQFVRAKIVWSTRPNAVVVPTTAVIFQGQDRFVYVAEPGQGSQVAKLQPIELGLIQGDKAEVIKGLSPGCLLYTSDAADE